MPVLVKHDRFAGEVRPGQFIGEKKIIKVDAKRVNTTITFEDDTTVTWRKDQPVTVGALEKTEEELQELYREETIRRVRGWCASGLASWEKFETDRDKRVENGWGRLDHWSLSSQIDAAARVDLAARIEQIIHDRMTDGLSEWEAVVLIIEGFAHEVLHAAMNRRVLSRSTSIMSNLCDDMEIAVKGDFLDHVRWAAHGIPELKIGVFDR